MIWSMITEIRIMTEIMHVQSVQKFRGNQNFRDHVRVAETRVADLPALANVA
jgi:hypothetical protein